MNTITIVGLVFVSIVATGCAAENTSTGAPRAHSVMGFAVDAPARRPADAERMRRAEGPAERSGRH